MGSEAFPIIFGFWIALIVVLAGAAFVLDRREQGRGAGH